MKNLKLALVLRLLLQLPLVGFLACNLLITVMVIIIVMIVIERIMIMIFRIRIMILKIVLI